MKERRVQRRVPPQEGRPEERQEKEREQAQVSEQGHEPALGREPCGWEFQ